MDGPVGDLVRRAAVALAQEFARDQSRRTLPRMGDLDFSHILADRQDMVEQHVRHLLQAHADKRKAAATAVGMLFNLHCVRMSSLCVSDRAHGIIGRRGLLAANRAVAVRALGRVLKRRPRAAALDAAARRKTLNRATRNRVQSVAQCQVGVRSRIAISRAATDKSGAHVPSRSSRQTAGRVVFLWSTFKRAILANARVQCRSGQSGARVPNRARAAPKRAQEV